MSFFISLGVIIISMLILACLELRPGVFSLFYHYASGKYSKARTSDITLFFILGTEIASALLFLASYFFTNLFFLFQFRPETSFFAWIIVGVLVGLALMSIFCYYRTGPGTRLFISRKQAKNLDTLAQSTKTRSDAIMLGMLSGVYELPFTIPLYIITSIEIAEMTVEFTPSNLLALLFILSPIIPLFIIRWKFQIGRNLADIQKARIKNKTFTRIILALSYTAIAILFIYFRIIA